MSLIWQTEREHHVSENATQTQELSRTITSTWSYKFVINAPTKRKYHDSEKATQTQELSIEW